MTKNTSGETILITLNGAVTWDLEKCSETAYWEEILGGGSQHMKVGEQLNAMKHVALILTEFKSAKLTRSGFTHEYGLMVTVEQSELDSPKGQTLIAQAREMRLQELRENARWCKCTSVETAKIGELLEFINAATIKGNQRHWAMSTQERENHSRALALKEIRREIRENRPKLAQIPALQALRQQLE